MVETAFTQCTSLCTALNSLHCVVVAGPGRGCCLTLRRATLTTTSQTCSTKAGRSGTRVERINLVPPPSRLWSRRSYPPLRRLISTPAARCEKEEKEEEEEEKEGWWVRHWRPPPSRQLLTLLTSHTHTTLVACHKMFQMFE